MRQPLQINGTQIMPGQRLTVDLPVARLYTHSEMTIPVHVIHSRREGPRLFVSAAIHGDELNGVEIIHRLLQHNALDRLRGSLIAVPIVNLFGFLNHSRYLPDRRDLNRFFPGSEDGSLTSRLAHLFMSEVVANCTHGIDLHTGANHRANLPHIRASLDNRETRSLAMAFGAPVVMNSNLRDGSLRQAVSEAGLPMLLFEGGEAMRFDQNAIRAGVRGILAVMRKIEMLPAHKPKGKGWLRPIISQSSSWMRAPQSGVLRRDVPLGRNVKKGEVLGVVSEPLGEKARPVEATIDGIVIGRTRMPLVNEGDALFHIAEFTGEHPSADALEGWSIEPDPDLDRRDEEAMRMLL